MKKIYLFLLIVILGFVANTQAQTYFSESFEGTWYLNGNSATPAVAAGPNAPSGWTQTRTVNNVAPATACATSGGKDWGQMAWSGTVYTSVLNTGLGTSGCSPYNSSQPPAPTDGTKILWFNDGWCSSGNTRRIESPSINLSTSTNPVCSFSFSYAQSSTAITFVGSLDGGTTWNTISAITLTTVNTWATKIIPIPAAYKIAGAKLGFQIASTFGSNDAYVDNLVVREGVAGTSTSLGGLWSSPATWVSGVIPESDATIASGAIVTVDQLVSISNLNISGTLQWNGTANAMALAGNLTINSGGKLLPYSTIQTGVALTVAGNFTNNGYANLALANSALTFNGTGSTLGGTGTFQGDGTNGIIRSLLFSNTGANTVSTSQNLILTNTLAHSAGSLNTGGKLKLDNTAQVYGLPLNLQVANVAVTTMGTAYSAAPVVFGTAVVQYANALAATANSRYISGSNVYLCTVAGTFNATPPTSTTASTFTTSGPTLLYLGTVGQLGNPFQVTAVTAGTQYFYNGNLYTCTVAGTPSAASAPTHTSSTAVSGTATFLYVGTAATATVNFDATTQTVRSLNLTSPGSGYVSAPSIVFSVGVAGGTVTTAAAATAVYIQQVAGAALHTVQKSGGAATISGGLTINSDQNAKALATSSAAGTNNIDQSSSGVGAISTTSGGVNYTVAPSVAFAGSTALNLITNNGSGYTTVPTINVTGGTLVAGATAYASTDFAITVNQGKVVSVYLTSTVAKYIVPPSLTFSAGSATLAFPLNCWPAATATIGTNGQVTNFTVTNAGYGYVAAPLLSLGTSGTFTTAAATPTARLGLYNLTLSFFSPATTAIVQGEDAAIPTNRKINTLSLSGNGNGMTVTSGLTLYGTSPIAFTASGNTPGNILDLSGNNLYFSYNAFAGITSGVTFGTSNAYVKNGSITLTGRGGSTSGSTFNFPFRGAGTSSAGITVFTGTGTTGGADGSNALAVKVTETAPPTNGSIGGATAIGNRAFKVETKTYGGANGVSGTAPTVALRYNSSDGLTTTQDQTYTASSLTLNGAWNVRSAAIGASGALAATGTLTTATAAPGPISLTGTDFFAWATTTPTITSINTTTLCANSGAFTLTGTNFTGVTAVAIGGTAVTSFTVVSATSITGIAGPGTDQGNISVTKGGQVFSLAATPITILESPTAPAISPSSATILTGGGVSFTATGSGGSINWYSSLASQTPIYTGANYSPTGLCTNTTYYVAELNGPCEGPRTVVNVTVNLPATIISASTPTFCGTGGITTLTAVPYDASFTYTWASLTSGTTLNTTTGQNVAATMSVTSDFSLTLTRNSCTVPAVFTSIGVYPLPSAVVATSASGVCAGTSATISSGLSAGNFSAVCISSPPSALSTPPSNAVTLVSGGWL